MEINDFISITKQSSGLISNFDTTKSFSDSIGSPKFSKILKTKSSFIDKKFANMINMTSEELYSAINDLESFNDIELIIVNAVLNNSNFSILRDKILKLENLKALNIKFSPSEKINSNDIKSLIESLSQIKQFFSLNLNFESCEWLENSYLKDIGSAMKITKNITNLVLAFPKCNSFENYYIIQFLDIVSCIGHLKMLGVDFTDNNSFDDNCLRKLSDIIPILSLRCLDIRIDQLNISNSIHFRNMLKSIRNLNDLEALHLGCSSNDWIGSNTLVELCSTIEKLTSLKRVKLNFSSSASIEKNHFEKLLESLKKRRLEILSLDISNCQWLGSYLFEKVLGLISSIPELCMLELKLSNNTYLIDNYIQKCVDSIKNLKNIRLLVLDLSTPDEISSSKREDWIKNLETINSSIRVYLMLSNEYEPFNSIVEFFFRSSISLLNSNVSPKSERPFQNSSPLKKDSISSNFNISSDESTDLHAKEVLQNSSLKEDLTTSNSTFNCQEIIKKSSDTSFFASKSLGLFGSSKTSQSGGLFQNSMFGKDLKSSKLISDSDEIYKKNSGAGLFASKSLGLFGSSKTSQYGGLFQNSMFGKDLTSSKLTSDSDNISKKNSDFSTNTPKLNSSFNSKQETQSESLLRSSLYKEYLDSLLKSESQLDELHKQLGELNSKLESLSNSDKALTSKNSVQNSSFEIDLKSYNPKSGLDELCNQYLDLHSLASKFNSSEILQADFSNQPKLPYFEFSSIISNLTDSNHVKFLDLNFQNNIDFEYFKTRDFAKALGSTKKLVVLKLDCSYCAKIDYFGFQNLFSELKNLKSIDFLILGLRKVKLDYFALNKLKSALEKVNPTFVLLDLRYNTNLCSISLSSICSADKSKNLIIDLKGSNLKANNLIYSWKTSIKVVD